jgi:hypothetical protein
VTSISTAHLASACLGGCSLFNNSFWTATGNNNSYDSFYIDSEQQILIILSCADPLSNRCSSGIDSVNVAGDALFSVTKDSKFFYKYT